VTDNPSSHATRRPAHLLDSHQARSRAIEPPPEDGSDRAAQIRAAAPGRGAKVMRCERLDGGELGMQLSRVRAISFDLDDTLWPFMPCVVRAEAALTDWLRTHAPSTRALLASPTALRDYRARVDHAHPELHLDFSALRRASIRAMLSDAGEDLALVEPAFEVFFEQRLTVTLYPDVLPALTRLSARYPLVGLSNGNGCVHRAGVAHLLKGSLSAATLGVAKPQAQAFHAAAALADVPPSALLHVGDDWRLDVLGAIGAGAQAAWVMREPGETPAEAGTTPHAAVSDLTALCALLAV
jgi:putative hydrolase of the HAD superfamily